MNTQIYVANLPVTKYEFEYTSAIDEVFLRQLFSDYNVCKGSNSITIKTKIDENDIPHSYAFITFETREDAIKAISELNYTKLDNYTIRLVLADEETKSLIYSPIGKLVITNLDPDIEVSQLHDAFANFGEVVSCEIDGEMDKKLNKFVSNGTGFVQFRHQEDANQAINDLKDASINGRPIQIQRCSRFVHKCPANTFTRCFIKHIPAYYNDENVRCLFSEFGTPVSCEVIRDEYGNSQKRAFCTMKNNKEAVRAIEGINGREIEGEIIQCMREMTDEELEKKKQDELALIKKQRCEANRGKYLYVKNFDESVTEKDLVSAFSTFRMVEWATIIRDSEGRSKKFGFVNFKTKEAAKECLKKSVFIQFNGKQLNASYGVDRMTRAHEMKESLKRRSKQIKFNQLLMQNALPFAQTGWPFAQTGLPFAQTGLPFAQTGLPFAQTGMPFEMEVQQDARSILRKEIMDKCPNNMRVLQRLRDLSTEQVEFLANDHSLFDEWLK